MLMEHANVMYSFEQREKKRRKVKQTKKKMFVLLFSIFPISIYIFHVTIILKGSNETGDRGIEKNKY